MTFDKRQNSGSASKNPKPQFNNGLLASPYSPDSILAQNNIETLSTLAQGIDDSQSQFYREYDKCGRIQNAFMQRAALAGIKNLNTQCFRKDSPVKVMQSRFPEKYV